MTDAEMIRKLTVKNIELEEENTELKETKEEYKKMSIENYDKFTQAIRLVATKENKLKAIEDEVNSYQFDSATNLQNKIKTILMSNNLEEAEH